MKEDIYESWPEEARDNYEKPEKTNLSTNRISLTTQRKSCHDQGDGNSNSDDIFTDKILTRDQFESFQGKLYSIYRHVFNGAIKEDPIMKIQRLQNELSGFVVDVISYNSNNHRNEDSVRALILNKIEDLTAELNDMKLNHSGYRSLLTKDSSLKKQLDTILVYANEGTTAIDQQATKNMNNSNYTDELEIENQLFQVETLLGVNVNCTHQEESNLLHQKRPMYPMLDSINRIEAIFSKLGKNPSIAQNIDNKLVALKTSLEGVISNHTRSSYSQSNVINVVKVATKINAIYKKYEKVNHLSNDLNIVSSRLENVDRLKALSLDINARIGLTRDKISEVKKVLKINDSDFNQVKQQFNDYMNDFHENVYQAIENEVNKYKKL